MVAAPCYLQDSVPLSELGVRGHLCPRLLSSSLSQSLRGKLPPPWECAPPTLSALTPGLTSFFLPVLSPLLLSDSIVQARMQLCLHRGPLLWSDSGPLCCHLSPAGRALAPDSAVCSVGPQWPCPTQRPSPITEPADAVQKPHRIGPLSYSSLGPWWKYGQCTLLSGGVTFKTHCYQIPSCLPSFISLITVSSFVAEHTSPLLRYTWPLNASVYAISLS